MTQESIVSRDDCREGDCIAFDDGLYVVVDRELMRRIDKAGNQMGSYFGLPKRVHLVKRAA